MDRSIKARDTVTVHQDNKDGPALATFKDQPYSFRGYDNYMYNGVMYPGYVRDDLSVYILLSKPLFESRTQ